MSSTVTDYLSLQQAIGDWLGRTDLSSNAYLPEIIQMGQLRIYQGYQKSDGSYYPGLRVRQMEKSFPGGNINLITITNAGSGYTTAPSVTFAAAPTGGITATGYAVLDNGQPITTGAVTSIVLTKPGQGYTTAPTITLAGAATATCTIVLTPALSASGNFAVPVDYLDLKYMTAALSGGTIRLERKPAEWVYEYYGSSGTNQPTYIARDGDVFITGPQADQPYGIGGLYYYQDALLSSTYTTNMLTNNFPLLLLAACLAEAGAFIKDQDVVTYWEGRYNALAATLQIADKREALSGSPLTMKPG